MRKKYISAACWGLPLSLIFAVSIVLHAGWISSFDQFFEEIVHTIPNLQGLMSGITFLASTTMDLVWMVIIAIILWFRRQRPLSLNIIITLLTADAFGWLIKHIARRPRPVQHLARDNGFSFPSGHTLGMSIIVLWLMLVLIPEIVKQQTTKIWLNILLTIWLILVMWSRVYLYAHYPSDVCGSVAIALMWLGFVELIWENVTPKTRKNNI